MIWLLLYRKLDPLSHDDIGIMSTRETDSERDAFLSGLFCEVFKVLDRLHDLLFVTLVESIDKTSE